MLDSALFTDHYELTMLRAALRSGVANNRAVFEVFTRALPDRRRYGVVAGIGRLVERLDGFRFNDDELAFLAEHGVVDEATRDYLASYRFRGDIFAYREGDAFFPGSPVLRVESTFGEGVVLETLVLSILNFDSAIASAAARMTCAAGERPCIEMGSRRTHEEAAVAAARAAYVAGFASTSNLAAGRRYGVPTTGTAAHAFTLMHGDEESAFATQVAALGADTTLLVDTYDVEQGIRHAVAAAGESLGAIRLDSGDLITLAHEARGLLDQLGARRTRIVVTGDLNEHAIAALAAAPVDAYGVGTSLVTGSGAPTAGLVYKLVARATSPDGVLEPVAKRSVGKPSVGGRKVPRRRYEDDRAVAELAYVGEPPTADDERVLQVPLVRAGEPIESPSLHQAREHWARTRAQLPPTALQLSPGDAAFSAQLVD